VNATKRRLQRGMTLIEIMVVVIIIGLIGTAVAVNVIGRLNEAKVQTAKSDIAKIADAIDQFKMMRNDYPTGEQALDVLIREKFLKANKDGKIKDPWGKEYIYLYPGQTHTDAYDVKSYGADGAPGGEAENADLVNN
jgi:general secretion pathway protein G